MALWGTHRVSLAAVFQAGCGRAMAQLELLWAAVGLMLLGVAVSLCIRCQLSGKATPVHFGVLPTAPAWAGEGGHAGHSLFFWGVPSGRLWSCSAMCWLGELCHGGDNPSSLGWGGVSAGGQRAAGGEGPPNMQHPFPGLGAMPRVADPSPWAPWWVALGHPAQGDHIQMHKSCRGSGAEQARKDMLGVY